MPAVVKKGGGFLQKYGKELAKAHEEHKADATEFDANGNLPPDMNGIARLVDIRLDQYKKGDHKGEWFFYAAGVVVTPSEHEGIPVEGLRTSIMEPLCPTPEKKGEKSRKTLSDHVAWVYNQLRLLGLDTENLEIDQLETALAALKESAPHFRFRTWRGQKTKQFPNPKTNHVWNGAVEYNPETGEVTGGVDDDATATDGDAGEVDDTPPATAAKPKPGGAGKGKAPEPAAAAADDEPDYDALAKKADKGDEDAASELTTVANEIGIDDKEIEKCKNWAQLAAKIKAKQAEAAPAEDADGGDDSGDAEAGDGEEWTPAAEEIYKYAPIDPKSKKAGKAVECEVASVDADKKTVVLTNLDNRKIQYKNVAWDKLESAS